MISDATKSKPVLSLRALCKQSGLDIGRVVSKLPEETRALIDFVAAERTAKKAKRTQQWKADIQKAVVRCLAQKKPLNRSRIGKMVPSPGCFHSEQMREYCDSVMDLAVSGKLAIPSRGSLDV
jgi:hypothetical protein